MTAKGKETRVAIRDDMGKSLSVLLVKLAAILGEEKAPEVRKKVDELFPELVTWPTESTPAIAGSDEPAAVLPKIITFDAKGVPEIEQEVRETVTKKSVRISYGVRGLRWRTRRKRTKLLRPSPLPP